MNILYELDENFAAQVCTSMVSVCENNKNAADIHFYVFGLGLSEQTVNNLTAVGGEYNRRVEVIHIDGLAGEFDDFDTLGWNKIVMGRLLLARFLPDDVHRVLYLDGDVIVRGSLAQLDDYKLDANAVLGAVIEATVDRRRLAPLGLAKSPYYNSGVLLIDLDKWREQGVEGAIVEYCTEHASQIVAPDQDAINGTLRGRIHALPPTYNYCNSYEFYPYRVLRKLMGAIPYYSEQDVRSAMKNPLIVHFLGEERPWRRGNTHTYRKEYRKYLQMTPYAQAKEEEGWEIYFLAWRVFNAVMKPIPMVRYKVITALIPRMLDWRKRKREKRGLRK